MLSVRDKVFASVVVNLLVAVACTLHGIVYSDKLPPRVPSHFDGSGNPDSWSSKQAVIAGYLVLVWVLAALWLGIGALIFAVSPAYMNLPNKEYWLATPERRHNTLAYLFVWLQLYGAVTNMFLLFTFQLMFSAAMDGSNLPTLFWIGFVLYMLFSIVYCVILGFRFRLPPNATLPEHKRRLRSDVA